MLLMEQSISCLSDALLVDRTHSITSSYSERGSRNNNSPKIEFRSALEAILMSKLIRPSINSTVDIELDQHKEECTLDFRSSKHSILPVSQLDDDVR